MSNNGVLSHRFVYIRNPSKREPVMRNVPVLASTAAVLAICVFGILKFTPGGSGSGPVAGGVSGPDEVRTPPSILEEPIRSSRVVQGPRELVNTDAISEETTRVHPSRLASAPLKPAPPESQVVRQVEWNAIPEEARARLELAQQKLRDGAPKGGADPLDAGPSIPIERTGLVRPLGADRHFTGGKPGDYSPEAVRRASEVRESAARTDG
ncbi:MAG: hypothetical protein ACI82F_004044 [Planctomycetota bacterium]